MAPNSARGRLALPADSLWLGGLGGVAPIRWSWCGADSLWFRFAVVGGSQWCGADSPADSLWFRFAGVGGIGELLILAPLWPVARVASPPWPADQRL